MDNDFLDDLKSGSTLLTTGVYLLKPPYQDKFPDYNCFVCIGDKIIFSKQEEPSQCAKEAKQYFADLQKRHGCTLSSIEVAMETVYQEGLYDVATVSNHPEQIDKIAINQRKAALGNPLTDGELLKDKASGTFIFRESSSIAGAKTLAFTIKKGEVGRYRLLVTAENMIIDVHNEAAPKSFTLQELEKYAATPLAADQTHYASSAEIKELLPKSPPREPQAEAMLPSSAARAQRSVGMEEERKNNLAQYKQHCDDNQLQYPMSDWLQIASGALAAVKKVHAIGLIHRNIKLDNFVYDPETKKVTVINFGQAKFIPEILSGGRNNDKTDIYALGKSIAELLSLTEDVVNEKAPFEKTIESKSIDTEYKGPIKDYYIRSRLLSCLQQMTDSNPEKRPTLDQAILFFDALQKEDVTLSPASESLTEHQSESADHSNENNVSKELYASVVEKLTADSTRLKTKYGEKNSLIEKRRDAITESIKAIEILYKKGQLSYDALEGKLNSLESKMISSKFLMQKLASLPLSFKKQLTTSTEVIKTLKTELLNEQLNKITFGEKFAQNQTSSQSSLEEEKFNSSDELELQTVYDTSSTLRQQDSSTLLEPKTDSNNPFVEERKQSFIFQGEIELPTVTGASASSLHGQQDSITPLRSAETSDLITPETEITEPFVRERASSFVFQNEEADIITDVNIAKTPNASATIRVTSLPFVPAKVDIADLEEVDGKFLLRAGKSSLEKIMAKGKISQGSYKEIEMEGKRYAIYKGVDHKKELGAGAFGKVKLMLDLESGQWYAIKIISSQQNIEKLKSVIYMTKYTDTAEPDLVGDRNNGMIDEVVALIRQTFISNPQFDPVKLQEEILKLLSKNYSPYQNDSLAKKLLECLKSISLSAEYKGLSDTKLGKGNLSRSEVHSAGSNKLDILKGIIGMELARGIDLAQILDARDKNQPQQSMSHWLQIANSALEAVKNVHKMGLIHRDIKVDNLVYDPVTKKVTVVDFGFALRIEEAASSKEIGGTPGHIAPEIKARKGYNEKTEVYALGISIAELFGLTKGISAEKAIDYKIKIVDNGNRGPIKNPLARKILIDYLLKMTDKNPNKRPSLEEAMGFFSTLQKQTVEVLGQFRKIGLLNLSEYKALSPNNKEAMHLALKSFDQVWLVDAVENSDKKEYLAIINELREAGINIPEKVFHGAEGQSPLDIINAIPAFSNDKDKQTIDSFYYVTPSRSNIDEQQKNSLTQVKFMIADSSKSENDYREEFIADLNERNILPQHFNLVQNTLEKDLFRLQAEYSSKNKTIQNRVMAIERSLAFISEENGKGKLSYSTLAAELTSLERVMISSNFLSNKLANLPFASQENRTTTAKEIKKLRTALLVEEPGFIKPDKNAGQNPENRQATSVEKASNSSDEIELQTISNAKSTTVSANIEAAFSSVPEKVDRLNIDTNNMSISSLDGFKRQSAPMGEDDDQFYMLPKAVDEKRDAELAEKLAKGFDCFICVGKNIIFSQLSQFSHAKYGPISKEEYFDKIAAKYNLDPVRFKNIISGPLPQTLVEKLYNVTLDDCASVEGQLAKTITLYDKEGNLLQQHHFIQTNTGNIIEINIPQDNHALKPEIYTCPDLNYSPKSAVTSTIAQAPHGVTEKLQDENKKQTLMEKSSFKSTTPDKLKAQAEQSKIRSAIGVARMPFIPKNVALADLDIVGDKLLVLTQDEINAAKTQMENEGLDIGHIEKTGKHETDKKKYTVIKMNNEYYVIYKGEKHGKHLEADKSSTVKLMQNLETGEWHKLKVIDHTWAVEQRVYLIEKYAFSLKKELTREIKAEIIAAIANAFKSVSISPEVSIDDTAIRELNSKLWAILVTDLKFPEEKSKQLIERLIEVLFIDSIKPARIEANNLSTVEQAKGILFKNKAPSNGIMPKSIDKNTKKEADTFRIQSLIGMELTSGIDLVQLASQQKLSASQWLQVAHGALHAISEVHKQGLMHRDIRGQNLIFDRQTAKVSVANFGSAAAAASPAATKKKYGAPGFKAPELYKESVAYNEKTEVFALGKTLAELFKLTQLIENKEAPLGEDYIIQILDTGSQKSHIKDPILRKELVAYLLQMTDPKPENRPPLKEAIDFFATLQNQLLDVVGQRKKMGILNLDDYQNADKPALYKALKQFDQVILVDTHQQHQENYLSIRKELEENGIIVSEKIFHEQAEKDPQQKLQALDIIQAIPALSHAEKSSSVDSFFYVVPTAASNQLTQAQKASLEEAKIGVMVSKSNKTEKDYAKQFINHLQKHTVSQQHFNLVIDTLTQDKKRIFNKPEENVDIKTEKVIIIQEMIDQLQKLQYEGKLSYDSLQAKLSELESKLISNNFIIRKLIDLPFVPFKNHTTSAKEIKKLKAALRMEMATLITDEKKQKPHSPAKPELQTIADSNASQSEATDASTLDISAAAESEPVVDNTSALSDTSNANNLDTSSPPKSEPQTEADFTSAISKSSNISQHDTSFSIEAAQFPFVPKKVDLSDLEAVGDKYLLLTQDEITLAKNKMAEHNTNRWFIIKTGKNDGDKKQYTVVKMKVDDEDKYYVIYKGATRGKGLGEGNCGKVKLMQDLDTGAWHTIKVIDHKKVASDVAKAIRALLHKVKSTYDPEVVIKDVIFQLAAAFNSGTTTDQLSNVFTYCSEKYGLNAEELASRLKLVTEEIKSTELESENLKLIGQSKGSILKSPFPDSIDKNKNSFKRLIGMELAPGTDFYALTRQPIPMPMSLWLLIASKALEAMQDFHRQGLIHRDIKSENLMYDPVTDKVSVIDVGLALPKDLAKAAESQVGTKLFWAPEILYPQGETISYNEKTEVFALGKTIAELLQLTREGEGKEENKLIIYDNELSPITDSSLREKVIEYLSKMTNEDPDERPTLQEAITRFEEIRKGTLDLLGQFRKVGILNLDDYMAPGSDKGALCAALKLFDQVVIVDANKRYRADYLSIRKELENEGVMLTEKLYHAPAAKGMSTLEIISAIPSLTAAQDNQYISSYFYVAPPAVTAKLSQKESETLSKMNVSVVAAVNNKNTSQYTQDISQHHSLLTTTETDNAIITNGLTIAKEHLNEDLKRLEGKVEDNNLRNKKISVKQRNMLNSRIEQIKLVIKTITEDLDSEKPKLSFKDLQELLTKLEKAMISTNKLTLKLADLPFTLHNTHSTSAKEIRTLQKNLHVMQQSIVPKDEVQPQIAPSGPGSSK